MWWVGGGGWYRVFFVSCDLPYLLFGVKHNWLFLSCEMWFANLLWAVIFHHWREHWVFNLLIMKCDFAGPSKTLGAFHSTRISRNFSPKLNAEQFCWTGKFLEKKVHLLRWTAILVGPFWSKITVPFKKLWFPVPLCHKSLDISIWNGSDQPHWCNQPKNSRIYCSIWHVKFSKFQTRIFGGMESACCFWNIMSSLYFVWNNCYKITFIFHEMALCYTPCRCRVLNLFLRFALPFYKGNLIFSIFRGPVELVLGITVGCLAGVMCWFFPNKNEVNTIVL